MARKIISPGTAPLIWSSIDDAFENVNSNFQELYASIGSIGDVGFDALSSDLIPAQNDTYDLGFATRQWRKLYLSESLTIGGVSIIKDGSSIDLPSGSKVGGKLIIDPDKAFFKEFSVNAELSVVADEFNDTLDFQEGTGIDLSVNSSSDTIIITNSGVTSLTAGTAMNVSTSTGAVTVTNTGVTSAVAGLGISVSSASGAVTFSNSGIVDVDAGVGISVGARDPYTGKVIITNTQPAGNAYRVIAVAGEANLTARSSGDTLTFIEGNGINITTALAAGAATNRVTFENTGVLSLTAGNGVTLSGSTGNITISVGSGDLKGSLFADDSTMLIDGTGARIVGDVYTSTLRTSEFKIALGQGAGGDGLQGEESIAIGMSAGAFTQGDYAVAIGSGAGNIGQGNRAVAIGATAGVDQGDYAISIGNGAGYPSAVAQSIAINASGFTLDAPAAGLYINPIRTGSGTGNVLTYNTTTKEITYSSIFDGDVTGSVFSDGSTMLIDGTEGKVVGPVDTTSVIASGYIQTGVYADLTAISAAYPVPSKGMIVFDDGTNQFRGYDGSSWVALN